MAKSRTPRIIIDEATGKEYQFNPDALKEIIHSRTDRKNHITQHSILQQLEEQCGLSVYQVQKWLSRANGIGNIDNVKIISNFLGINYHDILIDLNPTKEDKSMINNEEKYFIRKVFGDCISVLYKVHKITQDSPEKKTANMKTNVWLKSTQLFKVSTCQWIKTASLFKNITVTICIEFCLN